MEGTSPTSRSWVVWIALAVVGLVAVGTLTYMTWNGGRADRDSRNGLTAMYKGDYTTAQRYFTQAMNEARSPEDHATYEMLLAESLELTSADDAATHYLNVVNSPELPVATRGSASVYLLMLLNARHDPALTKSVFAKSPWRDLYQELKPDESINAEIAIAKAHEAIIETFPNFLSYLLAGEFYTRKYPYLTGGIARFREEYGHKATDYFDKGLASLRAARDSGQWDKTRLAIGYTYAMTYAVELVDAKLGTDDPTTLRALYLEASGFADDASAGEPIVESARFSIRLAYATYLAAHPKEADMTFIKTVANELGELAAKPVNQPLIIQIMRSTNQATKYGRLKMPLLFMASSSPALEKVLAEGVLH